MADALIPSVQNKDLNFIGTYVKNSDYKNFLRIQNNIELTKIKREKKQELEKIIPFKKEDVKIAL